MIEGLVMGASSIRGGDTELIMWEGELILEGETQVSSSGSGLLSSFVSFSSSAARASS